MKRISNTIFFAAVIFSFLSSAQAADPKIDQLENVPLPAFTQPKVTQGVLKNGIRYFLLEDHQLPLVHVSIITKVGGIYGPPGKAGLAGLTAISMRTGGTAGKSPEEVDKILEDMAAGVGIDIDRDMGTAGLKALSKDLYSAMPLFFDIIFKPRFDPVRVELGRIRMIESIRRENDYPEEVAEREFRKLVYGPENPWGRKATEKSVRNISDEDVRQFQKKYFVPQNMILAAAGDFKEKKFLSEVSKLTKDVPNEPVDFPKVEPVDLKFTEQKKIIRRPLSQAYIEMGHLGIKRDNPDKYAIRIMNNILGAPLFKSRLMEDIRSSRGLAYTIASSFGWGMDYGLFNISVDTKAKNTNEVIGLVRKHIERMAAKADATESELDFAKKSVLNQLIFDFDNSFKIVSERARYRYLGYPDNYWEIYRDSIEKVTLEDVNRVARKYLHPEGLSIVVVGPALK